MVRYETQTASVRASISQNSPGEVKPREVVTGGGGTL